MDIALTLLTIGINTLLAITVYIRSKKSSVTKLFFAMAMMINIWVASNLLTNHNYFGELTINDVANRLAYVSGFATVVIGVVFSFAFPTVRKVTALDRLQFYVVGVPITLLSFTTFIAGTVSFDIHGAPQFVAGPGLWLYALAFLLFVAILARNLRGAISKERGIKKRQAILVLVAFSSSALIGLFCNAILPLFANTWISTRLGPLVVVGMVGIIAYSIVKHGLFDIRAAVVRSTMYVLLIATLAGLYLGVAYVVSHLFFTTSSELGVSLNPINIGLALLLALTFQPIKNFFDRLTDRVFYRGSYDSDIFIAKIGKIVTSTAQLDELLSQALQTITSTLKASGGTFIVYRDHHEDALQGMYKHTDFTEEEYSALRTISSVHSPEIIITGTLSDEVKGAKSKLYNMLARKKIAVVLPLVSASEVIGYLLLNDQLAGNYSERDIHALETIVDELVIAIMNARSVQVVRDLNTHLEERISHATKELRRTNERLLELDVTKDEFLSMASHQLRTPLTSVKGYISMVLEGDAGAISPAQRQLLEEAYTSSERMVHLIGDFLNVSRLQTGKFIIDTKKCDLAQITQQEVDGMQQIAATHSIVVKFKRPARFPELYLDEGKIRQVIMNFLDNAIYYSPEGKQIIVKLAIEDGEAVLRVVDTGLGVPAAAAKKLFTKFYRADNARRQRPDGTGIGLYLAKKVIDGHYGNIVFTSEEGKGSTFGFRLPIKKLSHPPKPQVVEG
ncbi:MAG: ATP-binding protein [Candidatus Saccharimonas sp.]